MAQVQTFHIPEGPTGPRGGTTERHELTRHVNHREASTRSGNGKQHGCEKYCVGVGEPEAVPRIHLGLQVPHLSPGCYLHLGQRYLGGRGLHAPQRTARTQGVVEQLGKRGRVGEAGWCLGTFEAVRGLTGESALRPEVRQNEPRVPQV
jgi:hypothetical protein